MLDLQNSLVKLLKDFVIRDKEKLKRNEVLEQYFKRSTFLKGKGKNVKLVYFI